jgi:hypothetical protein
MASHFPIVSIVFRHPNCPSFPFRADIAASLSGAIETRNPSGWQTRTQADYPVTHQYYEDAASRGLAENSI